MTRPTYRMVFFETPRGNYIGKFVAPSPVDTAVATRTKVTALYQWGVDLIREHTGLDKDAFDLIMIER